MGSPDPATSMTPGACVPDGYCDALDEYIAGTNTHDFDNVRPLLHPDAVFRFSDADCAGVLAAQHYFEGTWAAVKDERYDAVDVAWRLPTPTTAIASYTYRWTGLIDGQRHSGSGRATNVFVTGSEGRWLLAHEHLSPSSR
jgi:ketosteroid isomerase-like protein